MDFLRGVVNPASTWRAIVLYGANSATYKFAFGRALLQVAATGQDTVSLMELADPYSSLLCKALLRQPRQNNSTSSAFLDACRAHNTGDMTKDELLATTVRLGFANVVDAFPMLGSTAAPVPFYEDRRRDKGVRGLTLTPAMLELGQQAAASSISDEVDARWRLVETAWATGLNPGLIAPVHYDRETETLGVMERLRRRSVTGVVAALSGYQDGRCAYCNEEMTAKGAGLPIVEHVLPFSLLTPRVASQQPWPGPDLDSVWNLVLACSPCNDSKHSRAPQVEWMRWLIRRNDDLIASRHPLRETLISQTGATPTARAATVLAAHAEAVTRHQVTWTPPCLPA